MSKPNRVIFVCMNQRPPGAKDSCKPVGAPEVFEALRAEVESRELQGPLRVAMSSCLGPCEDGPWVVVYPDDAWYGKVQPADAGKIIDAHS